MRLKFFTLTLIIFSTLFSQHTYSQNDTQKDLTKLFSTMRIINYAYVDSVDNPLLTETAIKSMLKKLDPHSVYFSKEEIKAANEPLKGNFEGVGIQFQIYKDTLLVVAPIVGGPSDKVGIMAGDKIITIDGENIAGKEISNKFVREHLRGKKGTKVVVGIMRGYKQKLIDFKIIRDKIPLNSIDAAYMLNYNTGYIKITRFAQTTMDEFHKSMMKITKEGATKLILDLRGNPGGYLGTAIALADEFLNNDKLIVFTEGLRSQKREFKSSERGSFKRGRLIVLINEGSASASEIVSGAVQDWGRGLIVGRRSFGKGLVQRPFTLPDSSVIRLTTARYHTPSGRCIQRSYDNGVEEYHKDIVKRMKNGEFVHADSIHFLDSLKYTTVTGKTIYGGGGIMPDIFIAWDSTRYNDYYTDIIRNRVPNEFTMQYLENNRKKLNKSYNSIKEFKKEFELTEEDIEQFLEFAKEKGVEFDEPGFNESKKYITLLLKAIIARNIFDVSSYYEIISNMDDVLQKAVELIEDDNVFVENKINKF
ncbi:MAG: S41 family peptidase [Bacteroidota bacterium]|nr:S41 family peptidase [Bacteroidota bacterium]